MEEEYRDIKGYEGYYKVSNLGNVRSTSYKGTRILKPCKLKNGYLNVILCVEQKKVHKNIHRLVAETFIHNPDNLPFVNHIDCNKLNNSVSNLEWCTQEYNDLHAKLNHRLSRYENRSASKMTRDQVLRIPEYIEKGATLGDLKSLFNVSLRAIQNIFRGETWTDLGIDFTKLKPNKKIRGIPSKFMDNIVLNSESNTSESV